LDERQFELHMEALDCIRCGIIDIEIAVQSIEGEFHSALTNAGNQKLIDDINEAVVMLEHGDYNVAHDFLQAIIVQRRTGS